jgi:5'-phosphate synthase pdxT subunit
MKIGVIALQGNIQEHVDALKRTLDERNENGEIVKIRHRGCVQSCDALIIPGGESTTLCRLIQREGMYTEIRRAASQGIPILGTCAGLILLAKEGDEEVERAGQELLKLMDIRVKRNAFSRQRESFEIPLEVPVLGESPFHAVFIRAPAIVHSEKDVEVIAKLIWTDSPSERDLHEYIIAARQGYLLALAFHPELTDDMRFHHYFIDMVNH